MLVIWKRWCWNDDDTVCDMAWTLSTFENSKDDGGVSRRGWNIWLLLCRSALTTFVQPIHFTISLWADHVRGFWLKNPRNLIFHRWLNNFSLSRRFLNVVINWLQSDVCSNVGVSNLVAILLILNFVYAPFWKKKMKSTSSLNKMDIPLHTTQCWCIGKSVYSWHIQTICQVLNY